MPQSRPRTTFDLSRTYPEFRTTGRAIAVPQWSRTGHHRTTPVGLDITAKLAFSQTAQVRETPKSVSQAENAGSIPVTRSRCSRVLGRGDWGTVDRDGP